MKRCPECNEVYDDGSMKFCVTDGTALLETVNSESTEVLFPLSLAAPSVIGTPAQTPQSSRQGVRPLYDYMAVSLLALLIGGAIVMWFKSDAPTSSEYKNAEASNTASSISQNSNRMTEEPKINQDKLVAKKNETERTVSEASPNPHGLKLYRVVGVAYNDVLYIRPKPGQLNVYINKIPANGVGIQILGSDVQVGKNVWVLVSYKDITGWVNRRFLTEQ